MKSFIILINSLFCSILLTQCYVYSPMKKDLNAAKIKTAEADTLAKKKKKIKHEWVNLELNDALSKMKPKAYYKLETQHKIYKMRFDSTVKDTLIGRAKGNHKAQDYIKVAKKDVQALKERQFKKTPTDVFTYTSIGTIATGLYWFLFK